jgi:hypothetical protein
LIKVVVVFSIHRLSVVKKNTMPTHVVFSTWCDIAERRNVFLGIRLSFLSGTLGLFEKMRMPDDNNFSSSCSLIHFPHSQSQNEDIIEVREHSLMGSDGWSDIHCFPFQQQTGKKWVREHRDNKIPTTTTTTTTTTSYREYSSWSSSSSSSSSSINRAKQHEHTQILWINAYDVYYATREKRIGPFPFDEDIDIRRIHYVLEQKQSHNYKCPWPFPSCFFAYHGTHAEAADQIQRQRHGYQACFCPEQRSVEKIPMGGQDWVYLSRDYLKARRFAYMDPHIPQKATKYAYGAIIRCIVPLPLPFYPTLHIVGSFPQPCSCDARKECKRPKKNYRADHTGETAKRHLFPRGVRQIWMDTHYGTTPNKLPQMKKNWAGTRMNKTHDTRPYLASSNQSGKKPEFLVTPKDVLIGDIFYIKNPDKDDVRDVRTYWPVSIVVTKEEKHMHTKEEKDIA